MNDNLSTRELFKNIINFKKSPRTLKWEFGYWGETVIRWQKEGFDKKDDFEIKSNDSIIGPSLPVSYNKDVNQPKIDTKISDYFDFDSCLGTFPYFCFYWPSFKEEVISDDGKYIEKINNMGIRVKVLKDGSSMPMWLEFPVRSRDDWERIKEERLRIDTIGDRFIEDKNTLIKKANKRDTILGVLGSGTGFFGSLRFLLGEEKLFMTYYDDPELIRDMVGHLCDLWLSIAEELTSKIEFDLAYFWEDMSGKNGSLISPAIFKKFMTPYYKRITGFLKTKGIDRCIVDTDGNVAELIPLFMEAGVTMMYPFERQAGNDLIEYRKKHPDLVMLGGFDKNTLYRGKEAIDRELSKMEWLISQGGYIPYCDHLVPPNVSWNDFKYYRNRLNNIIDQTPVK